MSRVPWLWYDEVEDETYAMPVNPYEDSGSNGIGRLTQYTVNAARYQDDSGVDRIGNLVYYGSDDVPRHTYNGRLYTQQQVQDFMAVVAKNYPLEVTDDLDRSFQVFIENFTLDRVRSNKDPWKHEYTLTFIVIQEL